MPIYKALYDSYTGLSPLIAQEICFRAGLDGDGSTAQLQDDPAMTEQLFRAFEGCMAQVREGDFAPTIYYSSDEGRWGKEGQKPVDFSCVPLSMLNDHRRVSYEQVSALLEHYYAEKNTITRIRQKSVDLRKIVQTTLERCRKKYDLQLSQMRDTEKKDRYRIYGELLNTYGYSAEPGAMQLEALNYYTGEMITIPLDPTKTAVENAQKYFARYNKLKRTAEALTDLIEAGKAEIEHLESIATALNIALMEDDLVQIKEELTESGYIRRKGHAKKPKITSRPFHYISRDGLHMYVGKNNYQNDDLTFKFANGGDWWFHAKNIPGSHVIVKTDGAMPPDATFEDAARLAAYYSQGRGQEKVEVDYTEKKNIKKPSGGKPGFVIYHTNYSMIIEPVVDGLLSPND
ncbi:MAG: NFACT family protein, partial [Lachnospiraceae bacterium]|jgi:predicted ribosome quality control (RQC) complex YloA/Tae2 family protein|nr:NFACT family protein [Lachnospiraceae bacterium]